LIEFSQLKAQTMDLKTLLATQQSEWYPHYVRYSISGKKFPEWAILYRVVFTLNILPDGKVLTFAAWHEIGSWGMNEGWGLKEGETLVDQSLNINEPDAYEKFMGLIAEAAATIEEHIREHEEREAAKPRDWLSLLLRRS
jgi:hypothetical protein